MRPLAAATVVFAAVAILSFPGSCSAEDAPPGTRGSGTECPRATTLAGFVWPNMYLGFVVVPLLALAAGAVAYALVRRTGAGGSRS